MDSIQAFYFDRNNLRQLADTHKDTFANAHPFPHIVIDNLVDVEVATLVADAFPSPDDIDWTLSGPGETWRTRDKNIDKLRASDETLFDPFLRHFVQQLNSAVFLEFLGTLTGIGDLVVDPTFNSCGLHSTGRDGKLMIHADSSRHPNRSLHQILNVILYVTTDWQEQFGGHLELWDRAAERCEARILPIFNRCVIFLTADDTYHGHPVPLTCPAGTRRNSIAAYYYVPHRKTDEHYRGWRGAVDWKVTQPSERSYKYYRILARLLPPILLDALKRIRRALRSARGK